MTISNHEEINYEELYAKYGERIAKKNKRYTLKDEELAQDSVQVAFMSLLIKVRKNEMIDDYYNYLLTAAKNYAINMRKKYSKVDCSEEIIEISDAIAQCESTEETFFLGEEVLSDREFMKVIFDGMKEKNPSWHYIVIEVFYKERSQVEVAEELNLSVEGLYATIRRIRSWAQKNKFTFLEELEEKENR